MTESIFTLLSKRTLVFISWTLLESSLKDSPYHQSLTSLSVNLCYFWRI
jgi:hypothetical protein